MKFSNTANETFFLNIIKHDLKMYEWKVLTAFIVDAPTFNISQKEISKRTGIHTSNLDKTFKGLVHQGILFKENGKYELNPALLSKDYIPENVSSGDDIKNPGIGDFKKRAETSEQKLEIANQNIQEMYSKKLPKGWYSYYSESEKQEIYITVEKHDSGQVIRFKRDINQKLSPSIAPMTITEEACRKVLNIEDPEEIVKYMYGTDVYNFMDKYKLKQSS